MKMVTFPEDVDDIDNTKGASHDPVGKSRVRHDGTETIKEYTDKRDQVISGYSGFSSEVVKDATKIDPFGELFNAVVSHESFSEAIEYAKLCGVLMNGTYFQQINDTDSLSVHRDHTQGDAVSSSGVDGKIFDMMYGLPVLGTESALHGEMAENDVQNINIDIAILPQTIIPSVGDYFVFDQLSHLLFIVTTIPQPHNVHKYTYYRVTLTAVDDTFDMRSMEPFGERLRYRYTTIAENVGSDRERVFLKDRAGLLYKNLKELLRDLIIAYSDDFIRVSANFVPILEISDEDIEYCRQFVSKGDEMEKTLDFFASRKVVDPYLPSLHEFRRSF